MAGWLTSRSSNERPFAPAKPKSETCPLWSDGPTITILAVTPDHGLGYIFQSRFPPLFILILGSIPDASTVPLPGTRLKADLFLTIFLRARRSHPKEVQALDTNSPRLSWETCGNCLTSNSRAGSNQGDIICCPSREESHGCVTYKYVDGPQLPARSDDRNFS